MKREVTCWVCGHSSLEHHELGCKNCDCLASGNQLGAPEWPWEPRR